MYISFTLTKKGGGHMFSKAKIAKYSALSIVFAAGVLFTLSAHAPSKARSSDNSAETASAAVNAAVSKAEVQAVAAKLELNNYVLKIIPDYEKGKYPYLLNNDYGHYNGVT
jgi:uncharacterized protein (UPF0333 family)